MLCGFERVINGLDFYAKLLIINISNRRGHAGQVECYFCESIGCSVVDDFCMTIGLLYSVSIHDTFNPPHIKNTPAL